MASPRTVLFALLAVLALVVTACGDGGASQAPQDSETPGGESQAATPGATEDDAESAAPTSATSACEDVTADQPVSVGFASATQPAYFPALVSIETSETIPMEPIFFQQSELAMQAVLQGEVDVLAIGINGPMITISEGAELQIFGVTIGNDWTIVANDSIQSPEDLAGARIGIHSETSTGTPLARGTLNELGIDAEFVTIAGSPNRAQAMTQDQIDATTLFLSDSIRLERNDPDKFHVLLDYAEVPFASQSLVASTEWLDSNPELAECFVTHFVETGQRMHEERDWAIEQLTEMFPEEDPEYLEALATEYLDRGLWVDDGGQELLSNLGEAAEILIELESLSADAPTDASDYVRMDLVDAAVENAGQ